MTDEALPLRVYLQMPAPWMDDGYGRAAARVRTAATNTTDGDARELAIAVFEAAAWATTIGELRGLKSDQRFLGLRHVRDRSLHGAAAAMYLDEETSTWRWYPSENLPPTPDEFSERYRPCYDLRLAGRPLLEIFDQFERTIGLRGA